MLTNKRCLVAIITVIVCATSGCNTRLESTRFYWKQSAYAGIGSLIVWLVVLGGFFFLLRATVSVVQSLDPARLEKLRSYVTGTIALWCLAALLLQALPCSATGIRLVPLLPWISAKGIVAIVSLVAWLLAISGFGVLQWNNANSADSLRKFKYGYRACVAGLLLHILLIFYFAIPLDI